MLLTGILVIDRFRWFPFFLRRYSKASIALVPVPFVETTALRAVTILDAASSDTTRPTACG